jgi:putative transposase
MNRGNYRWDVFGSAGAAKRFVETLEEAVKRYEWELGAYVVMRNHFHLAVRTPQPNLSAGMQWLQATFATRFNRMRSERGHLFQGRYKALVLENAGVWARVADYIHLNPLRAGIVKAEHLAQFRWSSLGRFVREDTFPGLEASGWLETQGLADRGEHWSHYLRYLAQKHASESGKPSSEWSSFTRGWAIGSKDWKRQLAEKTARAEDTAPNAEYLEPKEMQELRWERRFAELLQEAGLESSDLDDSRIQQVWKWQIADRMQKEMGVPLVWLAEALKIGRPATLRMGLWRMRQNVVM